MSTQTVFGGDEAVNKVFNEEGASGIRKKAKEFMQPIIDELKQVSIELGAAKADLKHSREELNDTFDRILLKETFIRENQFKIDAYNNDPDKLIQRVIEIIREKGKTPHNVLLTGKYIKKDEGINGGPSWMDYAMINRSFEKVATNNKGRRSKSSSPKRGNDLPQIKVKL